MSKIDILNDEIERRENSTIGLIKGSEDILIAIEQFNKLDEMYRSDEKNAREELECLYNENRHFTGKWPIVYSFAQTEDYPFFRGSLDTECNPYFPITKVKDGTFDGLAPLVAVPTKTGAHQRDRDYSPTEDVPRAPALVALQAFPNYQLPDSNEIGEWFPVNWPAAQEETVIPGFCTPTATPDTEAQCTIEGGSWTDESMSLADDPVWVPAETATALLRNPLNVWRANVALIQSEVCEDGVVEFNYWQGILDDIDIVLAEIQTDSEFTRATGDTDPLAWGRTPDFINGTPEDLARDRLIIAADSGVANHVAARKTFLNSEADIGEQVFFGIVKLRLHQANGSFSKLKTLKSQKGTNISLIQDNTDAIASLNLIKVKSS